MPLLTKLQRLSLASCCGLALAAGCMGQSIFENPVYINEANGLPAHRVTVIAQDHLGFLWFGTTNGLARYDGSTMIVFQPDDQDSTAISNEFIMDILPDSAAGKIWVATLKNISVYDIAKGHFKNYPYQPDNEFSPPDHNPYSIYKDKDGQVWASFRERGLFKFRPKTDDFENVLCESASGLPGDPSCISVFNMQADPENDSILWLGGHQGVYRFNRYTSDYQRYKYRHPDKKTEEYSNTVRCILPHNDGKVYFGTWYNGVFVLDKKTGQIAHFEPPCVPDGYFLRKDVVNTIYPKSDHEFWISSLKGLQLYDSHKKCVTGIWKNDAHKRKWYSVELIDNKKRIWSASHNLGVLFYNPMLQQFQTNYFEDEESDFFCFTRKILEDTLRKKLYVLPQAGRGLYILDQKTSKWSNVPPPDDYIGIDDADFLAWDMALRDDGSLFIVENSQFFIYRLGAAQLQRYPLQPTKENPRMRKIQKDRDGLFWVTGYGWPLQRLDLERNTIYTFDKELKEVWEGKLGADFIEEDKNGNIWMRENNGLLVYKKAEKRFVYTISQPGSTRAFRGMSHLEAADNGDIWVATQSNSLGYAHADSAEKGLLRLFTKKDGLIGDKVQMVKLIGDKLLVFTEEAIQWFDTKDQRFIGHIDLEYGLGKYTSACTMLASGALAVGKEKAIALFYPDRLITNPELPRPYLTSFKVFDKEWKLKSVFGQPDSVFLSYRQNFFSFEFSAINYTLPKDTRFYYKLEGFDEEWTDGTTRKFASYTNVPGGDYLFRIKAINSEGLTSEMPYGMYLHISTVWWKTWWFWLLAGLSLLGIGALVYRYKIGQVRKEERLKSNYERRLADVEMSALRAQMNPHFIFNSLNSIEYYIINNEPEKASDYLNRFSRLIRLILQNSKSAVVPMKDDLEALRLYIEMESLRFDNLFDYEVRIEKGIDTEKIEIPPMLMQPYVENAIWHGLLQKKEEKGKLDLTIRRENSHLCCVIEDNGIGREDARLLKSKSANHRKSFGMKITSDRLSMLNKITHANASVQVFDLKNEEGKATGTRVELLIPV